MKLHRFFQHIVICFILLIWCIAGSGTVFAAVPTTTPDPCSPDAPKSIPCPVRYDVTNVVIPRSQTVASDLVSSISQLLGQKLTATFNWAGTLIPAGGYHAASPKLTNYGQQVQTATENELKPAALQAVTTPNPTAQQPTFSMTSVECVHDPQTGAVINQFPSNERIDSKDPIPGLDAAIAGAKQLDAYAGGYTQVDQDYSLKKIQVSTNKVQCDAASTGQNVQQASIDTVNQNSYGTGGQNAFSTFITTITAAIIAPFQGGYRAQVKQTAEIQGKSVTPWIHYALCLFAGCKTDDMSTVSYDTDANKKQLAAAGGAVAAMYKPADVADDYKSDLNAADPSQQWNVSGAGSQNATTQNVLAATDPPAAGAQGIAGTAVNYAQARITAAGDYMNCTLMPADYQNTAVPDGACNQNWAAETISEGGWNCDTSVPAQSVSGLNVSATQKVVDRWFKSCENGKDNAWKLCMNDVIARAKKKCVDPLFALAIWIHESGASNYQCSEKLLHGQLVEDFGIHSNIIPKEDFSKQLDKYVQLPSAYVGNCPKKTLQNFIARFGPGVYTPGGHYQCYNELTKTNRDIVDNYINEIKFIYSFMAPGVPLPTWPAAASCSSQ